MRFEHLYVLWITYDQLRSVSCLAYSTVFGSLVPGMCKFFSCAQAHFMRHFILYSNTDIHLVKAKEQNVQAGLEVLLNFFNLVFR